MTTPEQPAAPWHITTWCGGRVVAFREPIDDPGPSFRHTVNVGWRDLLRGLVRRRLQVVVVVDQWAQAGPAGGPRLRLVEGEAASDQAPVRNDRGPRRRRRR